MEMSAPRIGMIDYGMGNLRSVGKAFEHCGAQVTILTDASCRCDFDALVLPGVGALGDCVKGLVASGLDGVVKQWIANDNPFFGICLGMQALFDFSEEGEVDGLGIFRGRVRRFVLSSEYKIPHMGWNAVRFCQQTPLNENMSNDGTQFYFVHSYHCVPVESSLVYSTTEYGGQRFVSAIRKGNCFATQFHPEKSQSVGLQMYRNFVEWVQQIKIGHEHCCSVRK